MLPVAVCCWPLIIVPVDWLTFGLAFVGYALLCADAAARAWRRGSRVLTLATAAVVAAHVALVWALRFEGSFEIAISKGWAGFLIFHGALALLLAAAVAPTPWSGRLVLAAFPVVTLGALGAALKYDDVAILRIPLLAAFATAAGLMLLARRRRRADA